MTRAGVRERSFVPGQDSSRKESVDFDIVVVGAGPAGLCFARALAGTPLRIGLVETQSVASLAEPAFDGREIALTHFSVGVLQQLGIWERFPRADVSPLRDARVINGPSLQGLRIEHHHGNKAELGYLISNHHIRKAAYGAATACPNVTVIAEGRVSDLFTDHAGGTLTLASGDRIRASLIVAADSRFSATRRAMGIAARMHDFGKVMMVCSMDHDRPHDHVAWEWFDYGQTLALLPMNGHRSSVVVTLPHHEMQPLLAMEPDAFNQAMSTRFAHRLGAMRLASTRHSYPLVAVYADQFVAQRFALVGDAAVGMHPVTAHGFNFGLRGADTLARGIRGAVHNGTDIAAPALLKAYQRAHRRATLPLFVATHAIARLYTSESMPSRTLRDVLIGVGQRVTPFKKLVAATLTGAR